jgi:hypothetical protein
MLALSLLVPGLLLGGSDARVASAIENYNLGEYAAANSALTPLADDPALSPADRQEARTYLAATKFALGDPDEAKRQLKKLFAEFPEAEMDPASFVPDLVRLAQQTKSEVAKARAPAVATVTPVTKPPPEPARSGFTLIPFGVGQFRNGDTAKGYAFLAGQSAAFATAIGSFVWLQTNKVADPANGLTTGTYAPDKVDTARTLNTVYVASFWAGIAIAAAGVIEGIVSSGDSTSAAVRITGAGASVSF